MKGLSSNNRVTRALLSILAIAALTLAVSHAGQSRAKQLSAGESTKLSKGDTVVASTSDAYIRVYFPGGEVKHDKVWLRTGAGRVKYYEAHADGETVRVLEGVVQVRYWSPPY